MIMEPEEIRVSPMSKTWILDLDGTLVVHDGPYMLGKDGSKPSKDNNLFIALGQNYIKIGRLLSSPLII